MTVISFCFVIEKGGKRLDWVCVPGLSQPTAFASPSVEAKSSTTPPSVSNQHLAKYAVDSIHMSQRWRRRVSRTNDDESKQAFEEIKMLRFCCSLIQVLWSLDRTLADGCLRLAEQKTV